MNVFQKTIPGIFPEACYRARSPIFDDHSSMEGENMSLPGLEKLPTVRLIGLVILAWLTSVGIDFFIHAGLLAELYAQPSPFLLPPEEAFRLIPIGYLSFLLLTVLLLWLMIRSRISSWRSGLLFGLKVGGMTWGAMALGLLSISTASPVLMLGWFAGQTVELGAAGAILGFGLSGTSLRKILTGVLFLILLLVTATIILQNL
jgi:hypothetical protein